MSDRIQPIRDRFQLRDAFPGVPDRLGPFEACALLDYQLHPNPGDHMLFVSALLWLSRRYDPARVHVAHRRNFSLRRLREEIGNGPIFFVGGGNLGDLWPNSQRFREEVIPRCPAHPVVLLPQSMYFRDQGSLERARRVFDAHPDLTIMLRDHVSLGLAREHFRARTCLTPDQSVLLADVIAPRATLENGRIYYLSRGPRNREATPGLDAIRRAVSGIPTGGWECMGPRGWGSGVEVLLSSRRRPLLSRRRRSGAMPEPIERIIARVDRPGYVSRSWAIIEQSIAQLDPFQYVLTDRFHGHVLSMIRRIPHTVIGNNHHKIRAHWESWTSDHPGVAFADSAADVVDQLRGLDLPHAMRSRAT